MSKTGYFDTQEVDGFTWRTHWEEKNGVITIPKIQLRSTVFKGPSWYPDGEISVNGVPVIRMDNTSPGTHVFYIGGAGSSFIDISVINNGQALPVRSDVINAGKAVITVNVKLYKDSSTPQPVLTGSAEIQVTTGLVQIQTSGGVKRHRAYIKHGGKIVPLGAVAKHGGSIKYCT
jgi:hypothetical protein